MATQFTPAPATFDDLAEEVVRLADAVARARHERPTPGRDPRAEAEGALRRFLDDLPLGRLHRLVMVMYVGSLAMTPAPSHYPDVCARFSRDAALFSVWEKRYVLGWYLADGLRRLRARRVDTRRW